MEFMLLDLPLKEPVPVFGLLLTVVLLFPLLFKKLKLPGIVGLIIGGMIIGPHGFGLVARDTSVVLLGSIGIIYIMFLAGLELDINQIKSNKSTTFTFGALTFFVPLILGFIVTHYILHYAFLASMIVALMFSTHTLVAYPIASRLGLTRTRSVTTVVGGTIFTDTAVLIIFGIAINYSEGKVDAMFMLRFVLMLSLFIFIVLKIFPIIAKWFFKNIEEENYSQFVFVFVLLLLSGVLAEVAGVEAIIGAFFAGLALNKLIPHNSALMNRLQFTGSAIFIPFFLINVGMIIDLQVLINGYAAFFIAVTLTAMALFSKWFAAFLTKVIFRYTNTEMNLMFGLSSSHAAATIAVILIGYNRGLLDINVLNGTVMLILVTCVISSFVTERLGRKLAIVEQSKKETDHDIPYRFLVPCANPMNIDKLLDLAVACKKPKSEEPIFPLTVMMDGESLASNILTNHKKIETYARLAYPDEQRITPTSRLDTNVANGIVRAVKEMMISVLILGWTEKSKTSEFFFGRKTDNILELTNQTIMLTRLNHLINITNKIFLYVGENSEYEVGFEKWLHLVSQISKNSGSSVLFHGHPKTLTRIKQFAKKHKLFIDSTFTEFDSIEKMNNILKVVTNDDLLVVVNSRIKSVSYNPEIDEFISETADKNEDMNFIVVYPETAALGFIDEIAHLDVLEPSLIEENINLYTQVKKFITGKK